MRLFRMTSITVLALAFTLIGIVLQPNSGMGGVSHRVASDPSSQDLVNARISFVHNVTLEQAFGTAEENGLVVEVVQHSFMVGDQDFAGFYPVESRRSLNKMRVGLIKAHERFLRDMLKPVDNAEPGTIDDIEGQKIFLDMEDRFREALQYESWQEPRISGLYVKGIRSMIEEAEHTESLIEEIEVISTDEKASGQSDLPYTSLALADWEKWVPEQGVITTGQSNKKERYVNISMLWDDASGFDASSTFEPDFFLNASSNSSVGRNTYLDPWEMPDRIPAVRYAASNLPRPYLDTRFGDPANEVAYTIGSAKARDIRANNAYYCYIRTWNGADSRDNAKFTAQLGRRSPSWCYLTWCSSSVDQFRIFSAWEIQVPGRTSWRR